MASGEQSLGKCLVQWPLSMQGHWCCQAAWTMHHVLLRRLKTNVDVVIACNTAVQSSATKYIGLYMVAVQLTKLG